MTTEKTDFNPIEICCGRCEKTKEQTVVAAYRHEVLEVDDVNEIDGPMSPSCWTVVYIKRPTGSKREWVWKEKGRL